jgi:hypothetical protein
MEVGSAFVRIRPFVSPDDAVTLEAVEKLSRDIVDAFDAFRAAVAPAATAALSRLPKEEPPVKPVHPDLLEHAR